MSQSPLHKANELKLIGNQFYKSSQYDKAIQFYTDSINVHPLVQSYSNRSMVYTHLQQYPEALRDCELALKLDNKHLKTILRKGRCLVQLLKINEAIDLVQQALKIDNGELVKQQEAKARKIKSNVEQYLKLRNQQDFVKAQALLEEISLTIKNNNQITIAMIQCKARMNKSQALSLLKSIERDIDQTSFLYWYMRAVIQLSHGLKSRSKRYLQQSIRYFNTKPLRQIERTILITFTKQNLAEFLENITRSQGLIKQVYNLVNVNGGGKAKQTIRKITAILDMNAISSNQRASLLLMRAKCFKQTKQKPKQLNDLNKLITIDPSHVQAIQTRLKFYEHEKDYGKALKDAEKLTNISTKHLSTLQRIHKLEKSEEKQKLDYYEILGVSRSASQEDIKKSYKQLAIIYHPDKNRGLNKQEQEFAIHKFKQIKKAETCLSNPQKRAFYDRHKCEPEQFEDNSSVARSGFDIFNLFRESAPFVFDPSFTSGRGSFGSSFRGNSSNFFSSGHFFSFTPNYFRQ